MKTTKLTLLSFTFLFYVFLNSSTAQCTYVWNAQNSGVSGLLTCNKSVSNLVGWIGGGLGPGVAGVRRTTDGGQTWTDGNPNPGVINGRPYAIQAIDANTAWCTTSPTGATYIYKTTNGGVLWTQVFTQAPGFIDDIIFINANTGFAYGDPVGSRWSLWKTSNGGNSWDSTGLYLAQDGSETGINKAMSIVGNNIWFGTNNTRVYHSTNFGASGSWTYGVTTGLTNSLGVHFNSPTLGLASGTTILKSTDGGVTYGPVAGTIPGSGSIQGLEGVGTDFWAPRGTLILRSTASGDNFATEYTGTSFAHLDFAIINGCPQGWAVGGTGSIAKMENLVGISNNNNQIPVSYKLEQNYPNPFNPTTIISYQLPVNSFVTMKIYDMLGREVATLVNQEMQAGSYQVNWDASQFASGIYFYRIDVWDASSRLPSGLSMTETKKMLLIK